MERKPAAISILPETFGDKFFEFENYDKAFLLYYFL